jgi:hypothetical protein
MSPRLPSGSRRRIEINRAPVLTLWAAVVAERLGFDRDAAVTLGRTVAGRTAAAKAVMLGLAEPRKPPRTGKAAPQVRGRKTEVTFFGRTYTAIETPEGLRALAGGKPVAAPGVHRYLEEKFGEDLQGVRAAMTALARSRPPQRLTEEAYSLYEAFRPAIARSVRGWGAKGVLDLDRIRALAKEPK